MLETKLDREMAFIESVNELKLTGMETDEELFFAQQEIHQALLDNKLISEENFFKAQERISKQYGKILNTDEKLTKQTELSKVNTRQNAVRLGMAANAQLFGDNKGVAAGLIVMDTAIGIQKSLAINPYDYVNVGIIAATGALNLANALSASAGGGGSISSPVGGGGGAQQQGSNFVPDTSSIELTESTGTGSSEIRVVMVDGSGNDLVTFISEQQSENQRNGRG